ncbi:MAG TPA: rod shape-determining protein MreD [Prolixibacteraceae bacterium]|nr:rod shape-determining protein MreD [Prolixibacteraceae bacterium]
MNKGPVWYIVTFVTIVLIQLLLMNNIQFSGYINPYFYILFIILLPISIPTYLLLIAGFFLGITIDIFSNTPGIHASATVFMSFIRPYVINSYNLEDQEKIKIPSIMNLGIKWFVKYLLIMVLVHHIFLFFIEVFSFSGFLHTLLRCILSSIFTFVFILISQFIVFRK